MDLGPPELLIILAVVLVLFGGAKVPELARSLGRAKKEFQEGVKGESKDGETATPTTPANPAPAPAPVPPEAAALPPGPTVMPSPSGGFVPAAPETADPDQAR